MADYIRIPADFFHREPITTIFDRYGSEANSIVLLYIELLCVAFKQNRKGIFTIANIELTDECLEVIFKYDSLPEKLSILQTFDLIERKETSITVFKFWQDKHDRNSDRYRKWRQAVFIRDGFRCRECGASKDLQAHHIQSWMSCKELRYSVDNGITLCRKCHLEAHGGCWHGRKKNVHAEDH